MTTPDELLDKTIPNALDNEPDEQPLPAVLTPLEIEEHKVHQQILDARQMITAGEHETALNRLEIIFNNMAKENADLGDKATLVAALVALRNHSGTPEGIASKATELLDELELDLD